MPDILELTPNNLTNFYENFIEGNYPNQRLGQAFCNTFGITNSRIFYSSNEKACKRMIHDYVMRLWA